jgi:16S rRNA (guanine966-N2)-methyltransferase
MRIVAGYAGGIPLVAPPLPARPTMDRVREAVFSSLANRVPNARVLDLFAGSGSYALEALSRGAACATAVENNRKSLVALQTNCIKSKLLPSVLASDVFHFLKQAETSTFDLIFADPPYARGSDSDDPAARLMENADLARILEVGGLLILETRSSWRMPETKLWNVELQRRYGDAGIRFLSKCELLP